MHSLVHGLCCNITVYIKNETIKALHRSFFYSHFKILWSYSYCCFLNLLPQIIRNQLSKYDSATNMKRLILPFTQHVMFDLVIATAPNLITRAKADIPFSSKLTLVNWASSNISDGLQHSDKCAYCVKWCCYANTFVCKQWIKPARAAKLLAAKVRTNNNEPLLEANKTETMYCMKTIMKGLESTLRTIWCGTNTIFVTSCVFFFFFSKSSLFQKGCHNSWNPFTPV